MRLEKWRHRLALDRSADMSDNSRELDRTFPGIYIPAPAPPLGLVPPPPPPPPPALPPPPPSRAEQVRGIRLRSGKQATSREAAVREMESGRAAKKALAILEHLDVCGLRGSCDFETLEATGIPIESITGNRNALLKKGLAHNHGERRVKPSTGNLAIVWCSCPNPPVEAE